MKENILQYLEYKVSKSFRPRLLPKDLAHPNYNAINHRNLQYQHTSHVSIADLLEHSRRLISCVEVDFRGRRQFILVPEFRCSKVLPKIHGQKIVWGNKIFVASSLSVFQIYSSLNSSSLASSVQKKSRILPKQIVGSHLSLMYRSSHSGESLEHIFLIRSFRNKTRKTTRAPEQFETLTDLRFAARLWRFLYFDFALLPNRTEN